MASSFRPSYTQSLLPRGLLNRSAFLFHLSLMGSLSAQKILNIERNYSALVEMCSLPASRPNLRLTFHSP